MVLCGRGGGVAQDPQALPVGHSPSGGSRRRRHGGDGGVATVRWTAEVADVVAIGDVGRPTANTTAEEMARLRPDLLTGELKHPKDE